MNIRPYEYLITIEEKGTLSGAARFLGVSQPTLSGFLSSTEKQLGYVLFERNGRTLIPTEAGLIYLEACRRIVDIKSQTYRAISDLTRRHRESFSVGVSPHRGTEMFSDVYLEFYRRFPDTHIDLKEGYMNRLKSDVKNGTLTMTIGSIIPEEQDTFGFSSHNREELLLSVPLYHPLSSQGSEAGPVYPVTDIRLFRNTPFVMWGPETTNFQIVDGFFKRSGVTPVILYESDNVLLLDKMLQKEIGVGFLPAPFCKPGQDRVYFSFDPPLYSMVGVFFRQDTVLTEAQRYFIYLITRNYVNANTSSSVWLNDTARSFIEEFQ